MRTVLVRLSLLLVLSLMGIIVVSAQDDMMEEKVVCDADLILSLYNAEYYFDYAAVHDAVMMGGMDPGFDLSQFEYGQFAPLFDGLMGMMDESMSMGMLDEEVRTGVIEMMSMSMDDMTMESMPEDSMMMETVTLAPGSVSDEPAACTALRDNLRQFYTALAYEN